MPSAVYHRNYHVTIQTEGYNFSPEASCWRTAETTAAKGYRQKEKKPTVQIEE
jgi:hypothetical protein